jgi:hypothetical protein
MTEILRDQMLGDNNPMRNPAVAEKVASKHRGRIQPRDVVERRASSIRGRPRSLETRKKIGRGNKGKKKTKEMRERCRQQTRRLWQDPKFVRKQMKARGAAPNKTELRLLSILDEHFPGQWRYVGDGEYFVGNKNPDFIHTSEKKAIDLFGGIGFFHTLEEMPPRIAYFEERGYRLLILTERHLQDLPEVISHVLFFLGEYQ